MMHGGGKSDFAIVAVKSANKVEQPAAEQSAAEPTATEPVERRAETKGNADQQSTYRAQSRVSVSQALERIRRVAKERKKEKFTSLLHHISIDLLDEAFSELKQDAAPGIDGMTWRDYEQNLERNLEDPVCGKAARTDLRGGRSVMGVPTATGARSSRSSAARQPPGRSRRARSRRGASKPP